MNTRLIIRKLTKMKCMRWVRRLQKNALLKQKQAQLDALTELHFLIHNDINELPFAHLVFDYIMMHRHLGWKLKVTELQTKSTNGHIGYMEHWFAGKLKYQKEMRLETKKPVEKLSYEIVLF